jgi:Ca2+-binding EF-hand superfamily protein
MSEEQKLSAEKIEQIREEFAFFDQDGNGQIDMGEFIELLTVLSPKTKTKVVEEAFALIDKNHDGHIEFDEFAEWWQSCWWEY